MRLIDAEPVIEMLKQVRRNVKDHRRDLDLLNLQQLLECAPVLNPAELVSTGANSTAEYKWTAEWLPMPGPGGWDVGWYVCGMCGRKSADAEDVCPHCKTKMKGVRR